MQRTFSRLLYTWLIVPLLVSCLGNSDDDPTEEIAKQQDEIIQEFLDSRGIVYEKLESGVFLYRKSPGNGTPVLEDDVVVSEFSASVFEGGMFYEQEPYTFSPNIRAIVPGMADGVVEMEVGEETKLFIPSLRGFSSLNNQINSVRIPGNSILVMDLKVINRYTEVQYNQLEIDSILNHLEVEGLADLAETFNLNDTSFIKVQTAEPTDPTSNLPVDKDFVTVNYTLTDLANTVTYDSGNGFGFEIGRGSVIFGFNESVKTMREGEKASIFLTSRAGYGADGSGNNIKPYTILRFEIEVVTVPNPD